MADETDTLITDENAHMVVPHVVRKLARMAISLGANGDDTDGTVTLMCRKLGLDPFAWYAICREIRDMQRTSRHIGFIRD